MNYKYTFTEEALNELGELYVAEMTKQLKAADKDASGKLIDSLDYIVREKANGFILEIKAADYLVNVNDGRGKGKKAPPSEVIEKWIKERNLPKYVNKKTKKFYTREQQAFVIARAIGRDGIKPTNVIQKTTDTILSKSNEILAGAFKQDLEDILEEIVKKLNKV